MDTNIITIRYQCGGKAAVAGGTCTATVSKREFDALVEALDPNMSATNRQLLAAEYSRLVIMAAEARRRGVDQSPDFATLMNYSKLQLLATRLVHEITSSSPSVSPAEVEKYFLEHVRDYQEVVLSRIFVPSQANAVTHGSERSVPSAETMYARATKGESFASLQREINHPAGTAAEPNVRMGPMRCQLLPEAHRQVCSMDVGAISTPLPGELGYSIYRLESRRRPELSEVREEIRTALERQQLEREIHRVRTPVSLVLDEGYFGKLPSAEVAKGHGIHSPAVTSPSPKPAQKHHQH